MAHAQEQGKQLLIKQWVSPNAEGRIDVGIVAPGLAVDTLSPGDIRVSLVSQDGTIYRAQPAADSAIELSLAGVPSGVYSLVARGPNLIASYAVHVVDNADVPAGPGANMLAVGVAEMRINKLRNAIIRYMPTSVSFTAEFDNASGQQIMGALAEDQTFRVAQTTGGISGRIFRAGLDGASMGGAEKTNILIYQNRELLGQTVTEEDGSFVIDTLAPGPYSLIAIGPDGFAVVGFTLVGELVAQNDDANGRLVSMKQATMQPQFELQLAPAGLESVTVDELLNDPPPPVNAPPAPGVPAELAGMQSPVGGGPGSVGGGGGYGGGGPGGGGGLGGVLGLTGAALGIAAIASDDDDGFDPPPVISPISP